MRGTDVTSRLVNALQALTLLALLPRGACASTAEDAFQVEFDRQLSNRSLSDQELVLQPALDHSRVLEHFRSVAASQRQETLPAGEWWAGFRYSVTPPRTLEELTKEVLDEIVRSERFARQLGLPLPAAGPILQELTLNTDTLDELGFRPHHVSDGAWHVSFSGNTGQLVVEMYLSRRKTFKMLLQRQDFHTWPGDIGRCANGPGEVCVERLEMRGTPRSDIGFSRGNVVVRWRGTAGSGEKVMTWIDEWLMGELERDGGVGEDVPLVRIDLVGSRASERRGASPVPVRVPRPVTFSVTQPRANSVGGLLVPENQESVPVELRDIDPLVDQISVSNGIDATVHVPVNGRLSTRVALSSQRTLVVITSYHGGQMLSVETSLVVTESRSATVESGRRE